MSSLHFETTVPADGNITLPQEYRGKDICVHVLEEEKQPPSLPKDNSPKNNPFFRKLSLEEIDAQQGGPKICNDPRKLSEDFPKIWDSKEDIEDFLARRKTEI